MLENPFVQQVVLLLVASFPLSILVAREISKVFSKHNPTLEKTTTILTDVYGVLTKEDLQVKTLFFNALKIRPKESSTLLEIENTRTKEIITTEKVTLKQELAIEYAAITSQLCHYGKLANIENIINLFFFRCGFNKNFIEEEYKKIQEIPTSEIKKISTVIAIHEKTKEIFSFAKGNPKSLLNKCSRILIDGQKKELTYNMRLQLRKQIKRLNQHGQKVIAFAYKGLPLKRLPNYTEEFAENDLIFLGMVSLSSQVNTEIRDQIETIKKLGLKTYIVSTTQERNTIGAAIELNMINPHYFETLSGADLKDFNDQRLYKMLENREKDYVFTELTGEDQLRIYNILRDSGEQIAVVDQRKISFSKIISAIRRRRIDKENTPLLAYHTLSCKIAELLLLLTTIIFNMPVPLSITLILFIELFINLPLELALRTTQPDVDVMSKDYKPTSIHLPFTHLFLNGILIGMILTGIYVFNLIRYGWSIGDAGQINEEVALKGTTITFLLLAISQIFNAYNINSLRTSVFNLRTLVNKYLLATTIIVILLTYILINFFILGNYLDIEMLSSIEWEIIIFATIVMISAEQLRKFITRKLQANADPNSKK